MCTILYTFRITIPVCITKRWSRVNLLIKLPTIKRTKWRTTDAQLYHSFSLERDDSEFITTNLYETDIRKFRRRNNLALACMCEDWEFINRSVQENAEDCVLAATASNDVMLFRLFVTKRLVLTQLTAS